MHRAVLLLLICANSGLLAQDLDFKTPEDYVKGYLARVPKADIKKVEKYAGEWYAVQEAKKKNMKPIMPKVDKDILEESLIDTAAKNAGHLAARLQVHPNKNIPIVNGLLSANEMKEPPMECPKVAQRSNCTAEKREEICWSPGNFDIDCPMEEGGFGLCCFDGCQNSCLKKTCRTIYQTEYEEVKETQCHDSTREKCEDVHSTVCNEVCRTEVNAVTEMITETVCHEEERKECRTVTTPVEKCETFEKPAPVSGGAGCPMIDPAATNCTGAEVSGCWSPGVEDVDCPLPEGHANDISPFGLCCFDGCSNQCLNVAAPPAIDENCELVTDGEECSTSEEVQCEMKHMNGECEVLMKRTLPTVNWEANDGKCIYRHNRHFTEATLKLFTENKLDSVAEVNYEDACDPTAKVCARAVAESCSEVCTTDYPMEEVEVEECAPPQMQEVCREETRRVCQPVAGAPAHFYYSSNLGQKKSKGHKGLFKSKGHSMHKREADPALLKAIKLAKKGLKFATKGLHKREAVKGDEGLEQYRSVAKREAEPTWHQKGKKGDFYFNTAATTFTTTTNCHDVTMPVCQRQPVAKDCFKMKQMRRNIFKEKVKTCKIECSNHLGEEMCTPAICPNNGNPAVLDCYNSNATEISQEEVHHCHKPEDNVVVPVCETIVSNDCQMKTKLVCDACHTVNVEKEECRTKPETVCKDEARPVVKHVPKEICEPACKDQVDEVCKQVPYQVCAPVVKKVEKKVPMEVCEW